MPASKLPRGAALKAIPCPRANVLRNQPETEYSQSRQERVGCREGFWAQQTHHHPLQQCNQTDTEKECLHTLCKRRCISGNERGGEQHMPFHHLQAAPLQRTQTFCKTFISSPPHSSPAWRVADMHPPTPETPPRKKIALSPNVKKLSEFLHSFGRKSIRWKTVNGKDWGGSGATTECFCMAL